MRKIHFLKNHPEPFADVAAGLKNCEFRKNDRDFKVGDTLVLMEFDPEMPATTSRYTGAQAVRGVTHILYGPDFGVPEGYCMMSLSGSGSEGYPAIKVRPRQ